MKNRQRLVVGILLVLSSLLAANLLPTGIDWHVAFFPAVQAVLHGHNPYQAAAFFNPPWAIVPLLPFGVMTEKISFGFIFVFALASFAYTAYRMGARPAGVAIVLTSLPVLICTMQGNIDWLCLLGLVLPARWGLLLILIKPQVGIGVAIYWAWRAWRTDRYRGLLRLVTPTLVAIALSFAILPTWPMDLIAATRDHHAQIFNSMWPVSIPAATYLLARALHKNNLSAAIASGPFFSPYVLFQSYSGLLMAVAPNTLELAALSAGIYIMRFIQVGFLW